MNIFTRITFNTMKHNPVRTLVTIIGIMISTAMFAAVTTFAISLFGFIYRTRLYTEGSWHLHKSNVGYEQLSQWRQDNRIEEVAVGLGIGYAMAGSSNDYKPYVYIEEGNAAFFELLPVHVTAGRLPEDDGEILVPEHLYNNGGVIYKLGDSVTFEIGKRYTVDEEGGPDTKYPLFQTDSFLKQEDDVPGEILITEKKRTYTVVGFYERPEFEEYSAPGYTLLAYCKMDDNSVSAFTDSMVVDLYAKLKQKYVSDAWEIYRAYGCNGANTSVLNLVGAVAYSNIAGLMFWIVVIFVLIIIVGSVSMIYSAFSISVSERTRQFGLLSSIGATRRQIRRSVFTEAALVSAAGIPAGVLCGILGIGITLHFVGNKFAYILTSPYSVDLVINGYAVLAAVLMAIFTVMISAIIPSSRAVRISAIDAIRQNSDVKVPKGRFLKRRKYRLTYKIFGVPGMLARRYFSRSRKKYRVTVFSLTMSIVLFIVTSSYCDYLKQFVGTSAKVLAYDLEYYGYNGENPEELACLLRELDTVKTLTYTDSDMYEVVYGLEDVTQSFMDYRKKVGCKEDELGREQIVVLFLDDISYGKYLEELSIRSPEYADYENAPGILCNTAQAVLYGYNEKGNYERYTMSYEFFAPGIKGITIADNGYTFWMQKKESSDNGEAPKTVQDWIVAEYPVGQLADKEPEIIRDYYYDCLVLTFPYSSKYNERSVTDIFFEHKDGRHEEMVAAIKEKLQENGYFYSDSYFYDVYAYQQEDENLLIVINVFSYGFIILMALICVANVFNTISTNIALRRRDFAMLRSVGLSQKGIRGMMVYECVLYGVRSLLFGLPVSAAFSYLLYRIYGGAGEFDFYIPWLAVLIAGIGVFAMVGISMLYAVSKIKRDNLIDELKEENA